MKKAFIGVGHGGSDPGAVANGLKEANLNLTAALEVGEILAAHKVNVLLSRYRDEDDDLAEEIRECNTFGPDVAVDMHTNAGGGDGFEVFHTIKGGVGKTLAQNIESEVKTIGQNSRGLKTKVNSAGNDYFGFIRSTNCPAVITEMAFIDNINDIKDFDEVHELKRYALAVAKGILKTLGIAYNGASTSNPGTSTGTTSNLYRVRKSWSDEGSQKGAFSDLNNAKKCADQNNGYSVFDNNGNKVYPITSNNTNNSTGGSIGVGSVVKVVGNKWATGEDVPSWVKSNNYKVIQVNGNKILLESIMSWVYVNDVTLVSGGTAATPKPIGVGSKVKVTGNKYATGESVPSWVKSNVYEVIQVNGNKVLLGSIMSWVYISDVAAV